MLQRLLRRLHMIKTAAKMLAKKRQSVYLGDYRVLTNTIHDNEMILDSRDLSLTPHIILKGYWEAWVTKALLSLIKPGMTVVEIGANVGYYTVLFGKHVGETGRVVAFEANPEMADIVAANLDINGLIPRASIERMLVADTVGTRPFTLLNKHKGSSSILPFTKELLAQYNDTTTTIQVPSTTLDAYWKNDHTIDLIKMDAEGSEPFIFKGMQRILSQQHLIIVCEFNALFFAAGHSSPAAFLDMIIAHGFSIKRITDAGEIVATTKEAVLAESHAVELVFSK